MPETISDAEILWFCIYLISAAICIIAIRETILDRNAIEPPNAEKKFMIVKWCFNRHSMMFASQTILLIIIINAMMVPQTAGEWNPVVIAFILRELILMAKI